MLKANAKLTPKKPKPPARRRRRVEREEPGSLEAALPMLARTGRLAEASEAAIREHLAAGRAVTYQEGNDIYREHPDGRREVVETLRPTLAVKRPKHIGRIRNG